MFGIQEITPEYRQHNREIAERTRRGKEAGELIRRELEHHRGQMIGDMTVEQVHNQIVVGLGKLESNKFGQSDKKGILTRVEELIETAKEWLETKS